MRFKGFFPCSWQFHVLGLQDPETGEIQTEFRLQRPQFQEPKPTEGLAVSVSVFFSKPSSLNQVAVFFSWFLVPFKFRWNSCGDSRSDSGGVSTIWSPCGPKLEPCQRPKLQPGQIVAAVVWMPTVWGCGCSRASGIIRMIVNNCRGM